MRAHERPRYAHAERGTISSLVTQSQTASTHQPIRNESARHAARMIDWVIANPNPGMLTAAFMARRICPVEAIKQTRQQLRGNPFAAVLDRQAQALGCSTIRTRTSPPAGVNRNALSSKLDSARRNMLRSPSHARIAVTAQLDLGVLGQRREKLQQQIRFHPPAPAVHAWASTTRGQPWPGTTCR